MSGHPPNQITRRIAMLVYGDCDVIDVCAPLDVFATANIWLQGTSGFPNPTYQLSLIAETMGTVRTFSGIRMLADQAIGEHDQGIDTLLVAGGGPYFQSARENRALVGWIEGMADRVRRIGSICTGAGPGRLDDTAIFQ